MKTIYFIGVCGIGDTACTDYFRGNFIVKNLIDKIPNYKIEFMYFNNLKVSNLRNYENNVFILVRGWHNDEAINEFTKVFSILKEKNILVHDVLDIYMIIPNWYNMKLYFDFENIFDFLILNSIDMQNTFKKYINVKNYVIYHSYDERIEVSNKISDNVFYYGAPHKIQLYNKKDYNFAETIQFKLDPAIHFTFLKNNNPYYYTHTSTKLATALATNSIFVCNRIPIMCEILGENYPFFCDDNENSLHETIEKAKKIILNKNEYKNYLLNINEAKIKLSPKKMIENYFNVLADILRKK